MSKSSITLSMLRGFEAAARWASFALAADELHLSHSAVSHQIKLLEQELGQSLFRRVGRSVVLSDAGADFSRTVRDILRRLEDGVVRLAPFQKPSGVILYTTMSFARGFLRPRLPRFRSELADVELWVDTSERPVDFSTDEVDVLITNASGVAANGTIDAHLLTDERVPVAAPDLIHRMGPSSDGAAAIAGWHLLHDESEVSWRQWFAQIGRVDVDTVSGSNFSDHALMIDAATDGIGVALASTVCADRYLRSGSLTTLQGPRIPQAAYRIFCDLRSFHDDQVHRVYNWFLREASDLDRVGERAPI